jgi:hypothetical protein
MLHGLVHAFDDGRPLAYLALNPERVCQHIRPREAICLQWSTSLGIKSIVSEVINYLSLPIGTLGSLVSAHAYTLTAGANIGHRPHTNS